MLKFSWILHDEYKFELKAGPTAADAHGRWWGLYVTNLNTGGVTYVGEERVSATIAGLPSTSFSGHTSTFGEDTHWWTSLTGAVKYTCTDFQGSAMAIIGVKANNAAVLPTSMTHFTSTGDINTGSNGYITKNCPVTEYTDPTNFSLQENLGWWPAAAPNDLTKYNDP
jgi:hypothetical protein